MPATADGAEPEHDGLDERIAAAAGVAVAAGLAPIVAQLAALIAASADRNLQPTSTEFGRAAVRAPAPLAAGANAGPDPAALNDAAWLESAEGERARAEAAAKRLADFRAEAALLVEGGHIAAGAGAFLAGAADRDDVARARTDAALLAARGQARGDGVAGPDDAAAGARGRTTGPGTGAGVMYYRDYCWPTHRILAGQEASLRGPPATS